jgi:LmbE family N-acetylglucosaminyl deacetylase
MEVVITHAYEGGHPDHDSCALMVQSACTLLHQAHRPAPIRLEFASYHERNGRMATGIFWSSERCLEQVVPLDACERARKRQALAQFVSQREMIERFPLRLEVERLRAALFYDFTRPPPPGSVLYDRFGWRLTGERWREKACAALATLGLTNGRANSCHSPF